MLVAALLVGCCKQSAEFAVGNQTSVVPLIVSEGTTTHFMTDYYPQWEGATNVTCDDERLSLKPVADGWVQFDITTECDALVSSIDVWHGDEKLSIVVLGGKRNSDLYMTSTDVDGRTINIVATQPVKEVVAMWQNEIVRESDVNNQTITVEIPAKAKKYQRSYIRVFAAAENGRFNDVLLPLEYGEVVVDTKDIRRKDFQSQILYSLMIEIGRAHV